jgi:hypothetical protein
MGIFSRPLQTGLKVIDKSDKRAASEAFVRALTAFLDSERGGKATTRQQSALANSRARVRELLRAGEYDEAVFRALRNAGFDL